MSAMDEKNRKGFTPLPGQDERGVDVTQIRELLKLTPAERIRHGVVAAQNMARLLTAARRK